MLVSTCDKIVLERKRIRALPYMCFQVPVCMSVTFTSENGLVRNTGGQEGPGTREHLSKGRGFQV